MSLVDLTEIRPQQSVSQATAAEDQHEVKHELQAVEAIFLRTLGIVQADVRFLLCGRGKHAIPEVTPILEEIREEQGAGQQGHTDGKSKNHYGCNSE